MARPTRHLTALAAPSAEVVSGNVAKSRSVQAAASMYHNTRRIDNRADRNQLSQPWQRECYRHVNICGEARYSVTLFANMAARAELGISEANALGRKAVWINTGPEVDVMTEMFATVIERKRLIRDFMTHYVIAGECYLIARDRQPTDPDPDSREPIWEIVGVLDMRKTNNEVDGLWQVRHDNDNYINLASDDPVIRLWNPDPENRREAWSPMRSLLPTLKEIEWLTSHIFTQVRSRLMSAGVWFLPEGLTFAPPSPEMVEGGEEAIALMNEAEQFMISLAQSSMQALDADEVSFPSVVMAESGALEYVDQAKLIKFWSTIDDKAMILRSDAVRRYALGWDLPPEQVLGASGLAVSGTSGSAGSVNHWGVWANEEQTISAHIEPALDVLVDSLTKSVVRNVVIGTTKVVGYDTASLRLRQDRSKEASELYDRGLLSGDVTLRENGFDPEFDQMSPEEWKRWMLGKIASGSPSPEQMNEALKMLGIILNVAPPSGEAPKGLPGGAQPRNLDDHPYEGPPREQHDHSPAPYVALPAPFTALHASCEALVLRALEKAGARLLNAGVRGRDRDRDTPPHMAHLSISAGGDVTPAQFDFSTLSMLIGDLPAARQARIGGALARFCTRMYRDGQPYTRDSLIETIEGL